jgi:hypothetical protein
MQCKESKEKDVGGQENTQAINKPSASIAVKSTVYSKPRVLSGHTWISIPS